MKKTDVVEIVEAIVDREINVLASITKNGFDRMEAGFREMRGEMNERFTKVDERFDQMQGEMNERFAKVDERFEEVDERFKDMKDLMIYRFDGVNRRIDDINLNYAKQSHLINHEERICVLEKKLA